jgi:hypothetical protein
MAYSGSVYPTAFSEVEQTGSTVMDEGTREELIRFAADLVRIQSYSGREEEAVRFIG